MLSKVFAGLEEKFGDDVAFVGPDRMDDTRKPPYIRWNPVSARILPPQEIGGGPRRQGAIARREWTVDVEVWGADLDATEVLVDRFRAVAHKLGTHFSFPPQGNEAWNPGGVTARGATCHLQFIVVAPILREARATVPVTPVDTLKLNNTPV